MIANDTNKPYTWKELADYITKTMNKSNLDVAATFRDPEGEHHNFMVLESDGDEITDEGHPFLHSLE